MNKVLQELIIHKGADKSEIKQAILRQILDLTRKAFLSNLSETVILVTILLCTTAVLGIIGNCILIFVLVRQISVRNNHSTNVSSTILVLCLGLVDLLVCVIGVPTSLLVEVWRWPTYDIACKVIMSFRCFLLIFSPMLLVLIALDRFLIICFVPSKKMTTSQTLLVIGFILLASISISIPSGLCTGVKVYLNSNTSWTDHLYEYLKYNISQDNSTANSEPDSILKLELTPCHVDETIVVLPLFEIYRKSIVILFFILLFLLVVFYSGIFGFIWYRHCYWFQKYGRSTIESSSRSRFSEKSSSYNSEIRRKTRSSRCIDLDSNSFLSTPTGSSRRMSNLRSITSYRRESSFSNSYNTSMINNSQQHCLYLHPIGYEYESKLIEDPDECQVDNEIKPEPLQRNRKSSTGSFIRRKSQVLVSAIQNRDILSITNRECRKRRPGSSRTAKTLLIVTLAFTFSYAPFLVVNSGIVSWLDEDIVNDTNYQKLQIKMLLFFSFHMSGAINPFIYILMNKSFRSDMFKSFVWLRDLIIR